MGILQDVFDALKALEIAKIDGQPTDDNINKLTTQLTAALVTISTENGRQHQQTHNAIDRCTSNHLN
jgi:hypothetical protein